VLPVERASFPHPWTEAEFLHCLRQRNCIGMVAEQDERIVGYMLYELTTTRLRLLNFAVAPELWRTGVGSQLADRLIYKLHAHRRERITLAVRERNLPAQLFFRAVGFKAEKVLPGYYADNGDDAYLMTYKPEGS
jgi:ribosomal-protein-alanine N-acetyltransferase